MSRKPPLIEAFLHGRRIAVAGVSRQSAQAANAIFRKLRAGGYDVVPVNPNATDVEGVRCYPNLAAVEGAVDGVVIATAPAAALDLVRQCADRGIGRVWMHRSFGSGSVSAEAVEECRRQGIACIVGGCPLMYCEPVDVGHRCMRWWLGFRGRIHG